MRKFFLNIIGILSLIIVSNFFVFNFAQNHYLIGYHVLPNKNFKSFIFSDSHGIPLGKKTEEFNVYNYSTSSDSYLDMYRKLSFLVDKNYQIDTVYITVDDHTLSPYRESFNNNDRSNFYLNQSDYGTYYDYLKTKYVKHYVPIFQPKIRSILKLAIFNKLKSVALPQTAADANYIEWSVLTEKEKIEKSEIRKIGQFPSDVRSQILRSSLREIIDLSKKEGFSLIGIKFPLSKTYIEVLDSVSYGANEVFLENDIPILDFKKLFIDNDNYFSDQDHLNELGGEKFLINVFNE